MKKVMITLGFAAATILAANAQETTPQQDPQNPATQTQPTPGQDETLDPQTQPMQDDQALDTQTEPMRDENMDTQPGALEDQPTTYPTDPTQGDVNETPMEPMEEGAGTLEEGALEEQPEYSTEDPQSTGGATIGDQPDYSTDPQPGQSGSSTIEDEPLNQQSQYSTETDPMDEAQEPIDETQQEVREMQGEPANPNRDSQTENLQDDSQAQTQVGEDGVATITEAELPQEVTDAFQDSEYSQATIEEVYVLGDLAVDKLMEADAEQMYIGEQIPDKLYQLQVSKDGEQTILYFSDEGEMMGEKSI